MKVAPCFMDSAFSYQFCIGLWINPSKLINLHVYTKSLFKVFRYDEYLPAIKK